MSDDGFRQGNAACIQMSRLQPESVRNSRKPNRNNVTSFVAVVAPSAASAKRAPFIPDDERTAQALGPKSIAFAAMAAKITTFRNLVLAHR